MRKKIYHWLFGAALLFPAISNGQGLTDDFNDNTLSPSWQPSSGYIPYEENGELRVQSSKQVWEEFHYVLPNAIDLTANPRVTVKVKADQDFFLSMGLIDDTGAAVRDFFPIKAKIWGNKEYLDVTFDFTGRTSAIDLTKIKTIIILFNPAYNLNARVRLDDFRVGSDAPNFPRLEYPEDQVVSMGNTAHSIKLLGLLDGTSVTATSSNTAIIPNPSVTAVSGGVAMLNYTPVADQSGTVTITATVSGSGYTNLVVPFKITVNNNQAPTIAQVADQSAGAGQINTINLTDIYDGNTEAEQTITITAASSDELVIKNDKITVNYGVDGKTHATLSFTPEALSNGSKTANITVTVKDNGGTANGGIDTKTMTFKVTVYPSFYKSPSFDFVGDNLYAPIGVQQSTIITSIKDGNGGTNIGSVQAKLITGSNGALNTDPTVEYTGGATAKINYTAFQKGSSLVVVTVTNSGAPSNSNGNTSVTDTFLVRGIDVPLTGYIEDFSASGILGSDYYQPKSTPSNSDWRAGLDTYPEKWYVEGQGVEQTLTLDPSNKKAILAVNKPNTIPKTFAGTWFSPRKLFDLSKNKYLSVTVSASQTTVIAFDIFDVNGYRYGKLIPQRVGSKPTTLTFVFNDTPNDVKLDFTKITTILINVSNLANYDGTVTITDLKIGDKADNAPAASAPSISLSVPGNRELFTNALEQKIDISDIYVIKEGLRQSDAVTVSATSSNTSLIPNPTVSNVVNGHVVLNFTPVSGQKGTATITITASANGIPNNVWTFTVDVNDRNIGTAVNLTYNSSNTHQTITGLGTMLSAIETSVDNLGSSWLRTFWGIGQNPNGLEYENDNDDPNVLDLSKFKHDPQAVSDAIKAKEKGVTKFIVSILSPPFWMKSNLSEAVPFFSNADNVLDPQYYDEFAEWIVGCVLKWKEETGTDIFAINLQNEPEFDEPYASAKYDANQLKDVSVLVAKRFKAMSIPTKIFFGEILPAQGHVLNYFQTVNNDVEAKDLVSAFAIHNYDADGIKVGGAGAAEWESFYNEAQRVDPKKELWMSETSGHTPNVYGAMQVAGNLYNALNFGNINGWNYYYANPETYGMGFYAQKNFYKFIRPGAVRTDISSSDSTVLALAFNQATDNTVTVVLINTGTDAKQVKLSGNNLPSTMYVYQTAVGMNTELIDSTASAASYLTILPANSITTLYNVRVGVATSINEASNVLSENFVVFPNPASHEVSVILPQTGKFSEITLTDIVGRTVKVKKLTSVQNEAITMDLQGVQPGLYFLSVNGDKHLTSKVIVK